MEEDILSTTLAYKKSPKTSKRTSFQDELQAAIAARASKIKTEESYSYADDFDDDDALEQLLNLRKKKIDTFRAGRKKAVEFKLSDEDEKAVKPKRVSFMKTRRKGSPTSSGSPDLGSTATELGEAEDGARGGRSGSSQSSRSNGSGQKSVQFRLEQAASGSSRSPSPRPLSSERSEERWEAATGAEEDWRETGGERQEEVTDGERGENAAGGEGKETATGRRRPVKAASVEDKKGVEQDTPVPQPRERSIRKTQRSGSPLREEWPKPKPRQRTAGVEGNNTEEESVFAGEDSRPPTSSVSIPLSSADRASSASSPGEKEAFRDHSPPRTEDECVSSRFSQYSSPGGQLSETFSQSTDAPDGLPERDEQSSKDEYSSTSFEGYQEDDGTDLNSNGRQSQATEKSLDNSLSSQGQSKRRPKSGQARAESRYLGALKVLDGIESHIKSQPEMADSVRATVYQEWLKSKQKVIKEAVKVKKLEEQLREEKKQQEEASRKTDAKASFAAWNEKKGEAIKAQLKEKREVTKKLQQETDEKAEKKEMAKKVFEKWKTGQDECLKEKYRKQKQAEQQLKKKEEEDERERKKNCMSSFSEWNQVKEKHILVEVRRKRREEKIKEEEEKYMKEEKGKVALEVYEKWLKRKERQERRERKQRKIRTVLQDEPPPPWSPPNKTIPFGR